MMIVIDSRLISLVMRQNLMPREPLLNYEGKSANLPLTTAFVKWPLSHTDILSLAPLMASVS